MINMYTIITSGPEDSDAINSKIKLKYNFLIFMYNIYDNLIIKSKIKFHSI